MLGPEVPLDQGPGALQQGASIKKAGRGDRDREEQGSRPSRPAQARKSLRQGGCLSPLSVIAGAIFSPLPSRFQSTDRLTSITRQRSEVDGHVLGLEVLLDALVAALAAEA